MHATKKLLRASHFIEEERIINEKIYEPGTVVAEI
jgi:hypothetical protein